MKEDREERGVRRGMNIKELERKVSEESDEESEGKGEGAVVDEGLEG